MTFPLLTSTFAFDAAIVGGGDFPTHPIALALLRRAPFVCACDGAAATLVEHGITPDAIVGDGDSLSCDFKQRYSDRLHIVSEQDDNDQTKATRHCQSLGHQRIVYLAMTGKREDHTLGNISLLSRYQTEMHLSPVMVTDHGYFVPVSGPSTIATFPGQQVSLFNISCRTLTGEGLRWPPYPFQQLWQGTLNEATGPQIRIQADAQYLVYLTHEGKTVVR